MKATRENYRFQLEERIQAIHEQVAALKAQVSKLQSESRRMRNHRHLDGELVVPFYMQPQED